MRNNLSTPNATPLMQRIEQACEKATTLPVPLRTLWDPDACPSTLLPYLAWALSVDRWDASWSTEVKRGAIRQAYFIHRRKGTVAAVRRVIEAMGYSMSIAEWWEIADPRGTFRLTIDVNEVGITDEIVRELERLIGDAKPVSRHIAGIAIATRSTGIITIGAAVTDGDIITVYPPDAEVDDAIIYDGTHSYSGNIYYSGVTE